VCNYLSQCLWYKLNSQLRFLETLGSWKWKEQNIAMIASECCTCVETVVIVTVSSITKKQPLSPIYRNQFAKGQLSVGKKLQLESPRFWHQRAWLRCGCYACEVHTGKLKCSITHCLSETGVQQPLYLVPHLSITSCETWTHTTSESQFFQLHTRGLAKEGHQCPFPSQIVWVIHSHPCFMNCIDCCAKENEFWQSCKIVPGLWRLSMH
jgi:hypothetical protein